MLRYRGYQTEAIDNIVSYLNSKNNIKPALAVLPTGAGKSIIIAAIIEKMEHIPTLILQPSKELLEQNYKKYINIGGNAKIFSASVNKKEVGKITYATIGSIKNKHNSFSHVKLVIIDEAHIGTSSLGMTNTFIKNLSKDVKVIGLTATPLVLKSYSNGGGFYSSLRMLNRIRPKFWNSIIHVTQYKDLLDDKYLTPLRFTTFDFGLRDESKLKGNDYNLDNMSDIVNKKDMLTFTKDLINESIKRGKGKILVFTPTVKDAYTLKDIVDKSDVISSDTKKKDRTSIFDKFVNGEITTLINFGTLTTGVDVPEIDLIICLRATKSFQLWYQLIGRGVRIAKGKDVCDIIDLSGNFKVFGDPKDMTIQDIDNHGWGVVLDNKLITGVPYGEFVALDDLSLANMVMPMGKHKGDKFKDIPKDYLVWLAAKIDKNDRWVKTHLIPPLMALNIISKNN